MRDKMHSMYKEIAKRTSNAIRAFIFDSVSCDPRDRPPLATCLLAAECIW